MLAARLTAPRQIEIDDVMMPAITPDQVRIHVQGCGICGSNLPVWTGRPWFSYPLPPGSPGHEPWGEIVEVGEQADGFHAGERVAFLSERAFAEFAVADVTEIVSLPDELQDPFPAEPLACAVNVVERSQIARGDEVTVVGSGFLGALVIMIARARGATVRAVSRRPFALDVARLAGADDVKSIDDTAPLAGSCRCVIECAGEQRTLDIASAMVSERGRLVIAGYHQDGPRQVDMQSWNWRGLDVINAHERARASYVSGMRKAVELVANGTIDPQPLYTHTFPLDAIDRAFETAAMRPDGFLKALVTM